MIHIILILALFFFCLTEVNGAINIGKLGKIPPVDFCLADANETDIYYYLFKSKTQTTGIVLTAEDYSLPQNDTHLPTKVFIHGFTGSVSSPWLKPLKNAYFNKGPHNIIYVDWTLIADPKNYTTSTANINPVAQFIADFIIKLRIPLSNIHIIAHSLGGHLAGFVGQYVYWKTGKKVGRITATDPTGPGFEKTSPDARLSELDAQFVDVVHTDMGYFGAVSPLGHVDFYANGGKNQPGCKTGHEENEVNCHHMRASYYFIESVNKRYVMAKSADLNEKEEIVVRSRYDLIEFGDQVNTSSRGIYHFKTNSAPPYLISRMQ